MAKFTLTRGGEEVCSAENADGLRIDVDEAGEVSGPIRIEISGGVLEIRGVEGGFALTIDADPGAGLALIGEEENG